MQIVKRWKCYINAVHLLVHLPLHLPYTKVFITLAWLSSFKHYIQYIQKMSFFPPFVQFGFHFTALLVSVTICRVRTGFKNMNTVVCWITGPSQRLFVLCRERNSGFLWWYMKIMLLHHPCTEISALKLSFLKHSVEMTIKLVLHCLVSDPLLHLIKQGAEYDSLAVTIMWTRTTLNSNFCNVDEYLLLPWV